MSDLLRLDKKVLWPTIKHNLIVISIKYDYMTVVLSQNSLVFLSTLLCQRHCVAASISWVQLWPVFNCWVHYATAMNQIFTSSAENAWKAEKPFIYTTAEESPNRSRPKLHVWSGHASAWPWVWWETQWHWQQFPTLRCTAGFYFDVATLFLNALRGCR